MVLKERDNDGFLGGDRQTNNEWSRGVGKVLCALDAVVDFLERNYAMVPKLIPMPLQKKAKFES